jgi:hypothetical protein
MLAQWVARAYRSGFTEARTESLITLGSAPLDVSEFRSVVLGQLGESRLIAAIDTDIAGTQSHARALDADTKGSLRDIHRRVATVILFESSGGQSEKVAHLPELRFALGESGIDTTTIDNAAVALDARSFFIRKVGADGFRIGYKPKLNKVVNDRRASLDEDADIRPEVRRVVDKEFERGATLPRVTFPSQSQDIPDSPRLTLVIADPEWEWIGKGSIRDQIGEWTKQRGKEHRLYPGALIWCLRKPGRDLRDNVELMLAWRRVNREVTEGTLGSEFDRADIADIRGKVTDAENDARNEVWADYRYVVLADNSEADGLKVVDLGAGHSSSNETLCGRVIQALRQDALLNESVGAGYIARNWPPALDESGAWPLSSLRQAFVNGSLTRLLDPEKILRSKIVEFVENGDFGLGSGHNAGGSYDRIWFQQSLAPDEVSFEADVFLLKKERAKPLSTGETEPPMIVTPPEPPRGGEQTEPPLAPGVVEVGQKKTVRLQGTIPPEVWNRFGTKILPKMRAGQELTVNVDLSVTVDPKVAQQLEADLHQIADDIGVSESVVIDQEDQ